MGDLKQRTLTGETTDQGYTMPDTFRYCLDCERRVLRSRWGGHEDHDAKAAEEIAEEQSDDGAWDPDAEADDDPAEKVGEVFDVTLSYTVDYRFRIPAWDEHTAKDRAKERVYDADPVHHDHVHTRITSVREVYDDDDGLPEDYDLYGGEPLWEAFDRGADD